MPLLLHESIVPAGELGIWRITEPEAWFLEQLFLYPAELRQLAGIQGRRRREWLAARQLVHQMSGREVRGAFVKDEYGKPHLADSPLQISISHSHELAAAMAAPVACGIDIQHIVPKISRLTRRFIHPDEEAALPVRNLTETLHVYWGAKEALYKAHGRRELDWREQLRVAPFTYSPEGGIAQAWWEKEGERQDFLLHYRLWEEEYILVWVVAR